MEDELMTLMKVSKQTAVWVKEQRVPIDGIIQFLLTKGLVFPLKEGGTTIYGSGATVQVSTTQLRKDIQRVFDKMLDYYKLSELVRDRGPEAGQLLNEIDQDLKDIFESHGAILVYVRANSLIFTNYWKDRAILNFIKHH